MDYVVLDEHEQNQPENYPEWCDLSWFHDCHGLDKDVERHYHDLAEIWLWHEGTAEAIVGGEIVQMRAGVMVYTPPQCLHGYSRVTQHSNTGITPRAYPGSRHGHLHVEETGEVLQPPIPAFWLDPERNTSERPAVFPRDAFLKTAYSSRYSEGQDVFTGRRDAWWAVLVREGQLLAGAEDTTVPLPARDLLIVNANVYIDLRATASSEVAFAIGWPS